MTTIWNPADESVAESIRDKIQSCKQRYQKALQQLDQLRSKHLRLEIEHGKLKQMYQFLYSQQIVTQKHGQIVKQFIGNQWSKTIYRNNQITEKQLRNSNQKRSQLSKLINQLRLQSNNTEQSLQQALKELASTKIENTVKMEEYQLNSKEKEKVIKILFGKIYLLQKHQTTQIDHIQTTDIRGYEKILLERSVQTQHDQYQNYVKAAECLKQVSQLLLDQILGEYYQTFMTSISCYKGQPNFSNFKNNLALINSLRLQPYCVCLQKVLEFLQPERTNQKQKWIINSVASVMSLQKLEKERDKQLSDLFRFSSLYYRIQNSTMSDNKISKELLNRVKILLFRAFVSYDRQQAGQKLQQ